MTSPDGHERYQDLFVDPVSETAVIRVCPAPRVEAPPVPDDALEFDLCTPSRWSELPRITPPRGVVGCAPYLVVHDAGAALGFYGRAFGAQETARETLADGRVSAASLSIGQVVVLVGDDIPELRSGRSTSPAKLGGTPVTIHLTVDGVEAFFLRAVQAGARVLHPLCDTSFRGRLGVVEDPFGHRWSLSSA